MTRVWLPTNDAPVPFPRTEHDRLRNEIHELGYYLPGAEDMDIGHLRDLVQAYREKKKIQDEEDVKAGEAAVALMSPEQIKGAVAEYIKWKRKREIAAGLRPRPTS